MTQKVKSVPLPHLMFPMKYVVAQYVNTFRPFNLKYDWTTGINYKYRTVTMFLIFYLHIIVKAIIYIGCISI